LGWLSLTEKVDGVSIFTMNCYFFFWQGVEGEETDYYDCLEPTLDTYDAA
jgi:hypothetical protein